MRTDSVLQKYTHYIIHTLMTGMYNVISEDRLHNYLDTTLNKNLDTTFDNTLSPIFSPILDLKSFQQL